jgi:uncharacterized membrane protein (UPF0127 family)
MRRFQKLTDPKEFAGLRFAAVILAAFLLWGAASGSGLANTLPTDRDPIVIETRSGPVEFTVELALTPEDRSTGLMNRQSMPATHGMLFRFERTRQVLMWMKNTPLSLDMVFINEHGKVAGIAADTTPFSEAIIPSPGPVRYVLELNAGTAARTGIRAGDKVRHRVVGTQSE